MKNKFNFDKEIDRRHTFSLKWDVQDNELPMWVADMDFEVAPPLKEALIKRAEHGIFGYSIIPDEFFLSIINWYTERHHFEINKEWMIYSNGVVAAISSMVRRLTSPGDQVLIQSPVYNIFYNSIINNKCHVLSNDLVYENGKYEIDFDDLEKKLAAKETTLMILCNPHNPIGKIWNVEELRKIGHLCHKYNVKVISDEVHCEIVNPGLEYVPFLSIDNVCQEVGIACISISKTFNMAGMQSACVIVPNKKTFAVVERGLNTDEVAEPNAFSMLANITAFSQCGEWVEEMKQYVFENKQIVYDFIKKELPLLHVVESEATYLMWIDIQKYHEDSVFFCQMIREKTGLYINDGAEYGENGRHFIRINIATTKKRLYDGLSRLKKALVEL